MRALLACVGAAGAVAAGVTGALAAQGDLDPSFSGDGKVVLALPTAIASDVVVDARGRTLIAGRMEAPGSDPRDSAVVRLTPNGALDRSWSGDGIVNFDASQAGDFDRAQAIAIDSLGRVVVAGFTGGGLDTELMIARLGAGGSLDQSFGQGDGIRTDNVDAIGHDAVEDLIIDASDRPVAVGTSGSVTANPDWIVARYTTAGSLDGSFAGGAGYDTINVHVAQSDDFAHGVGLDSQGRIVVGGNTKLDVAEDAARDFAAARWTSAGQLDTSFSGGGVDTTPGRTIVDVSQSSERDAGFGLVVMPGDKPLVAGDVKPFGGPDQVALLQLTAAGVPDSSFSGDGKAFLTSQATAVDVRGVALDRVGKIVIAGFENTSGHTDFLAARFLPTGGVDPSFSGDGRLTTAFGDPSSTADAVAVDPRTGRVILAGQSVPGADSDWALARYEGVPRCAGKVPTLAGTGEGDRLRGTAKRDVIWAGPGNDLVRGVGGRDVICGDAGRDRLLGGRGGDRLIGGPGPDRLIGGPGPDRLIGGPGPDRLIGGPRSDRLLGGAGRDRLLGGRGRDLLRGGPGRDVLRGGPGGDRQRQ